MKQNLVNIELVNNRMHLWRVNEDGSVYMAESAFNPYLYSEISSEFQTIDGYSVGKKFFNNMYDLKENKHNYERTWESDIDPITRFLIDNDSYKCNRESGLISARTWLLDIECLVNGIFPNSRSPVNPINAISFYDTQLKKLLTVSYHPTEYNNSQWKERGVIVCQDEVTMLQCFVSLVEKLRPQIISGWNSEEFDYPLLLNRILKILGPNQLQNLSSIKKVDIDNQNGRYKIYGITELDYLKLYKKFSINLRESYGLKYIAKYELGETKIEFEGSLDDLWLNNFSTFIEYSRKDVELLKKIDEKYRYIDLARELASTCNVSLNNIWFTSSLNEGLILTKAKELGIVCNDKSGAELKEDPYEGAYVKDPDLGLKNWVFSLDLTSLYPAIIRSCNMSPETIVDEVVNITDEEKYFRTCNNQYFIKEKRGIIPQVLDEVFQKRIEYKDFLKKAKEEKNEEKEVFYDMKQYTYKILLNSMYGYIGMSGGRFFDKRIAEGVTLTGQAIIKSSIEYIKKKYGDKVLVCAGDTDSVYLSCKNYNITKEEVIKLANQIMLDVNENHLKNFAEEQCNIVGNEKHYFLFKFEKVCETALFIAKKRYALNVVWDEGFDKDHEIKITGIETVRSDTPEVCKDFLKELIKRILFKQTKEEIDQYIEQFKIDIKSKPLLQVGFPVGVKGIDKYLNKSPNSMNEKSLCNKKTPIHVRAAINYNAYFSDWGDSKVYPVIKDREKIKWIYVNSSVKYQCTVMAFTDENYKHMKNFNIDWENVVRRLILQKVSNIYEPLGWSLLEESKNSVEESLFS